MVRVVDDAMIAEFDAHIESMVWGRSTYTIIRLPADAVALWKTTKVKRVAGEIDGVPVDLAITTAPVIRDAFVWAGAALLRRLEAEPGELVHVRLGPTDPDSVVVPDDVASALAAAGLRSPWDSLSPGKRRGLLYRVDSARTEPTRQRRIRELCDAVPGRDDETDNPEALFWA
jgi:hypothetical protein